MALHSTIEISGFKSIRHAKIELSALNVLIGPNGAGKTNFIGAFKLLNLIVERKLGTHVAEGGYAAKFLYFGPKGSPSIGIKIQFLGGTNWYSCELSPNAAGLFFSQRSRVTSPAPFGQLVGQEIIRCRSGPGTSKRCFTMK